MFGMYSLLHFFFKVSVSLSLVICLLPCQAVHTAWEKMRQCAASGSLEKRIQYNSAPGTAPSPTLPSVVRMGGSIQDQYSLDNLTSAFNSMCPDLCFVSWLLIKWMPPGHDFKWKDSTETWTIWSQVLVSMATALLSPHFSLPVISVSPLVNLSPSITGAFMSHFKWRSSCF